MAVVLRFRGVCEEDIDNSVAEGVIGKTKVLTKFELISSTLSYTNLGEIILRMK